MPVLYDFTCDHRMNVKCDQCGSLAFKVPLDKYFSIKLFSKEGGWTKTGAVPRLTCKWCNNNKKPEVSNNQNDGGHAFPLTLEHFNDYDPHPTQCYKKERNKMQNLKPFDPTPTCPKCGQNGSPKLHVGYYDEEEKINSSDNEYQFLDCSCPCGHNWAMECKDAKPEEDELVEELKKGLEEFDSGVRIVDEPEAESIDTTKNLAESMESVDYREGYRRDNHTPDELREIVRLLAEENHKLKEVKQVVSIEKMASAIYCLLNHFGDGDMVKLVQANVKKDLETGKGSLMRLLISKLDAVIPDTKPCCGVVLEWAETMWQVVDFRIAKADEFYWGGLSGVVKSPNKPSRYVVPILRELQEGQTIKCERDLTEDEARCLYEAALMWHRDHSIANTVGEYFNRVLSVLNNYKDTKS